MSAELVDEGVTLGVVGLDQVADRDVQRREREVIRGGEVIGLEGVDDVLRESLEDGVDVLGGRAFVGLVIFKQVDPSKVLRGSSREVSVTMLKRGAKVKSRGVARANPWRRNSNGGVGGKTRGAYL